MARGEGKKRSLSMTDNGPMQFLQARLTVEDIIDAGDKCANGHDDNP